MATRWSRRRKTAAEEPSADAITVTASESETASTAPPPESVVKSRTPLSRMAAHVAMLILMMAAASVRLTGSYWGDQGMHPDERGIYMRIDHMRVVPVDTRGVSSLGAFFRLVDTNLRTGADNARREGDQEDLNPEHFAYGSILYTS
jgi:hypothetical protein